jgi:hypothetical protein
MNFLATLLRGIAFVPSVVQGVENLFGKKTGTDKKDAALNFVGSALAIAEAVSNKDIVDVDKFRGGLGLIIDGTVQCLNASVWAAKAK